MTRNFAPKLVAALHRRDLLPSLLLLDVGASGGIPSHYRSFGERLAAVGFDPQVAEIERLNQAEPNLLITYEAAWIGCDDSLLMGPADWETARARSDHPWSRLSAARAAAAMAREAAPGPAVELARLRYGLDNYVARNAVGDVDMIKIDTDGHDFEVLLGAAVTLAQCRVLGVEIEVQLHGAEHPCANVFHNIDRFLRGRGFSLFDFAPHRYSRAALPARFFHDFPAQTVSGQVVWADAVYLRDLADPDYRVMHRFAEDRDKLLKLCCLFEIFGLPDCAAELLLRLHREEIVDPALCRLLLDELAPEGESYDTYVARFDRDPTAFYPSHRSASV